MSLGHEADTLLLEASKDEHGTITYSRHWGGETLQTNGRNFTESGDARTLATWRDALERLLSLGLIMAVGASGNVYQVTKKGYDYADGLEAQLV